MTFNISDGHDAVLDSISLPVATSQIAGHQVPLSSFKLYSDGVDDVMSDPFAYVDFNAATPLIKFRASGGSFPDGCTAVLNIAGSYEV
jgi:DNA-binding transcriptional regulator YbjK